MPNSARKLPTILVAEDDPDDRLTALEAFAEASERVRIEFVRDGVELLAYLRRHEGYVDQVQFPMPSLVLVDLNMPRKGGREVLREMKADPKLRLIPVVALTTSSAHDDIVGCYHDGASSFVTKPARFGDWIDTVREISRYWFSVVALPEPVEHMR